MILIYMSDPFLGYKRQKKSTSWNPNNARRLVSRTWLKTDRPNHNIYAIDFLT